MLPQFNIAFFASQLFWLAVCFGVFYFLTARFALPRISEVLSERQRRIDDDLDRATQLKSQTEAAILAYELALDNARLQAHNILQQSHAEVTSLIQSCNHEVAERLGAEIKVGEERIAAAKQVALGQVKEIAIEVAETAISRLVGFKLSMSCYQKAVTVVTVDGRF